MAPQLPFVSVVLPVRNEARFIRRCLDSVFAQDYPRDRIEVIVADGMSSDRTRELAAAFRGRRTAMRVIDNPGRIVPTGLNGAIGCARGDVIVRVDGHCEIAPDYVRRCVEHLQSGVDAVGGPIETIGETTVARAIALGMSSRFGVGNSAFRTSIGRTMVVDTVAFPAYPRHVLERVGPFDEELVRNQDDEYNYRLRKLGGRVLLAADVRSRYYSRSSLTSLWRQYFQYGYWKVRVLQKHPRQMSARQFAPAFFVLVLTMALVTAAVAPQISWAPLAIVAAYAAAALTAAATVAARDPRTIPVLPLVFATLHVSYGLGFFRGLVTFRKRWQRTRDGSPKPVPEHPVSE
jgi:succinoglycan biosynthesis protein ExoA